VVLLKIQVFWHCVIQAGARPEASTEIIKEGYVTPGKAMQVYGGVVVHLHVFLTMALDGTK